MSEENEKTEAEIEKYNLTAIPLKKVRLLNFVFLPLTLSGLDCFSGILQISIITYLPMSFVNGPENKEWAFFLSPECFFSEWKSRLN